MNEQKPVAARTLADCKELYLKYNGRQHRKIEAEMHERGWKLFRRRMLYNVTTGLGKHLPGWIERFGWADLLHERKKHGLARFGLRRRAFENWLRKTTPQWSWHWPYQVHIYKMLIRIMLGESRRLMIFLPPRHGKSELVTVRFTAWMLEMNPKLNVILGSYNQKLANRFSRKIKRVLDDSAFTGRNANVNERASSTSRNSNERVSPRSRKSTLRNRRVSARMNTSAEWETLEGGGLRAVGVGGGVTGFGAGLIVIDDPVKSRAEAESPAYREKTWNWFNDDIYTRLEPDAAIILIQTRWHEDDLAGRLLKEAEEEGGEKWDVICLSALAEEDIRNLQSQISDSEGGKEEGVVERHTLESEIGNLKLADPLGRQPGEALCPQRFDEKALERIKRKLGSYSFSALYQQRPVPAGGGLFKRDWFTNIVDKAPDGLKWKRGYDLAVSTKTSADYTASFRCAKDNQGNLFIEGGFRARIEYPEQRRYIIQRMQAERNTEHGIELALHGHAFVQDLRREIRLSNVPFRGVNAKGDKFTRALAWANLAEAGRVFLVRGPWVQDFIEEACRFTGAGGGHDDQVDAVSLAVEMLAKGGNGFHTFR